jgi:hypothetical protein
MSISIFGHKQSDGAQGLETERIHHSLAALARGTENTEFKNY